MSSSKRAGPDSFRAFESTRALGRTSRAVDDSIPECAALPSRQARAHSASRVAVRRTAATPRILDIQNLKAIRVPANASERIGVLALAPVATGR